MNRRVIAALTLAFIGMGTTNAMHFGVGPMIGTPIGLSAKLWTRPSFALDAGVGYAWWNDSSYQVHGDLLFHSHHLTSHPSEDGALGLYMGLGAQMRLAGEVNSPNVQAGLRMPLGLEYIFPSVRFGIYAEAVPIFNLGTTDQYFSGEGAFGFRFYWAAGSRSL
jgi:hypothetical protein